MASIITHSIAGVLFGKIITNQVLRVRFWIFIAICGAIPDIDIIAFKFGIPYQSFWGHRGFTHSFVFAFLFGLFSSSLYLKSLNILKLRFWGWTLFFFLVTSTHTVLDAMTNGGHGVAMLSPFDNTRHFFEWRPIKVSPLGIKRFFTQRGVEVLKSEFIYVILPMLGLYLAKFSLFKVFKKIRS